MRKLFHSRIIVSLGLFFNLGAMNLSAATVINSTSPGGNPTNSYQPGLYTMSDDPTAFKGFFQFKNGITAGDRQLWWHGDGIVNGPITIGNAGSLTLQSDLRLGSTATLVCDGDNLVVYGEGHSIILGADTVVSDGIYAYSNLTIDGQGHTLTMERLLGSDFHSFSATRTSSLTLKNMTLVARSFGDDPNSIFREGDFVLENVVIKFDSPASFNDALCYNLNGSDYTMKLTVRGNVEVRAPGKFVMLNRGHGSSPFTLNLTIDKNSTFKISPETTFVFTEGSTATTNVTMQDSTSLFHFNGCDVYATSQGASLTALQLTKGTVLFENKVRIFNSLYSTGSFGPTSNNNTDMTKGFILGDGTAQNDVNVRMLGGAYVTVDGCLDYRHS